jgi:hypothetical protein
MYRYQPRGIVVFSAHWDDPELLGQFQLHASRMSSSLLVLVRLLILYTDLFAVSVESTFTVTDYGSENPLLYDVGFIILRPYSYTLPRILSLVLTINASEPDSLSPLTSFARSRSTTASRKASMTSLTAVGAITTSRAWSSIPLNPTTFPLV